MWWVHHCDRWLEEAVAPGATMLTTMMMMIIWMLTTARVESGWGMDSEGQRAIRFGSFGQGM